MPNSVNVNGSRTNGSRAFVDNQSSFIVGEGSNLHVGTVENTGAIIGKQSENGTTFKVDKYVGHDIQNYDTMTTTGISVGTSLGKSPRVTNIGFNQDDRDKQGITRNTVVGNVEIGEASGSPINRDITRANEVTKDKQHSTKINVESQTIEYATNPGKLKEDIGKAKEEINDIKWAIKESIHDRGDDNRNFFGQLSEVRLDKSLENITSERLIGKTVDTEIADVFKDAYKDLGYDINIIFSDPKNSPQLLDENDKPKTGTAYVRDENGKKIKTIIINGEDPKNATKAGLIGTIVEEGSHVIGKVEGRQRKTGTDEKGLESTGRASNEYFAEKYKDNNTPISIHSDGKDYSNVDFGENVGDKANEFADVGSTSIIPGLSYKFNMSGDEARKYVDQQLTSIFGTSVNWNDYFNVKNVEYREKMNYYFGLAKNTLRVKKIIGTFKKSGNTYIKIVQDNNKEMILKELPETEALYHNLKIVNGEIHMNFTNLNRKFVQDDGYELITTKNLKQLKGDPVNQATYNTYSYLATIMTKNKSINLWDKIKGSGDGLKHLDTDVKFWTLYGTSPQDPTNNKVSYNNMPSLYDQRQRLANRSLGKSIVDNYDIYKKAASYHNNNLSLTQLENLEKNMSGIKKLTGNEQVNKIKSILGVK